MRYLVLNRPKLSETKLLVLIAVLLLVVNITGDHVFNKVNHLKVLLAATCLVPLLLVTLLKVKTYSFRLLFLFFLPLLATFPGAILSQFHYSYGLSFELMSQAICVIWAFLLFSLLQGSKVNNTWKFMWAFIPTVYFVCLVAFLEKIGWSPLINIPLNPFEASSLVEPWMYQGIQGRVESTFGNINYFASFLIQVLPLCFALFLISKSKTTIEDGASLTSSIVALFSVLFVLIALLITETRSALFAALISLTLFSLLLVKIELISRQMAFRIGLMLLASIIMLILVKANLDSDRFSVLFRKETWWPRLVPWQTAWDSFLSAPFFGHGLGSSYQLFFEYVAPDSRLFSSNRSYNHVHNEILQVLQEGGVFGLVVYLGFWIIPMILGVRFVLDSNNTLELRLMLAAIVSGLLAYHIHGLFSVAPRMISSRLIAYSLLACLLAILFQRSRNVETSTLRKSLLAVILIFIITSILVFLTPFLQGQYLYSKTLIESARTTEFIELAGHSEDIYILEAAAKEAFESEEIGPLLAITKKASELFPYYREMDTYRAYALYWSGDTEAAYQLAMSHQKRDEYSAIANSLLLAIAIERESEGDFLMQLTKVLNYQACRNRLRLCGGLNIKLVSGYFALPFQIIAKEESWNVLVDKSFLMTLKGYKNKNLSSSDIQKSSRYQILKAVSVGGFFKPESVTPDVLMETDMKRLSLYLRYVNQDKAGEPQALLLAGKLEKALNLKLFLQKRALLIELSSALANAIK